MQVERLNKITIIIEKDTKKHTQKILMKELYTSKVKAKQK